ALDSYYFNSLDEAIGSLKEIFPVAEVKMVFEAITSADVEVSSVFGAPLSLKVKGQSIDADLLEDIAIMRNGDQGRVATFEKLRGLESSYWEHAIFEPRGINRKLPAVSTVRLLQ